MPTHYGRFAPLINTDPKAGPSINFGALPGQTAPEIQQYLFDLINSPGTKEGMTGQDFLGLLSNEFSREGAPTNEQGTNLFNLLKFSLGNVLSGEFQPQQQQQGGGGAIPAGLEEAWNTFYPGQPFDPAIAEQRGWLDNGTVNSFWVQRDLMGRSSGDQQQQQQQQQQDGGGGGTDNGGNDGNADLRQQLMDLLQQIVGGGQQQGGSHGYIPPGAFNAFTGQGSGFGQFQHPGGFSFGGGGFGGFSPFGGGGIGAFSNYPGFTYPRAGNFGGFDMRNFYPGRRQAPFGQPFDMGMINPWVGQDGNGGTDGGGDSDGPFLGTISNPGGGGGGGGFFPAGTTPGGGYSGSYGSSPWSGISMFRSPFTFGLPPTMWA